MIKKENEKGITLIALAITIIVLLILASITVYTGKESITESKTNILLSEVQMVQHAALERYTKEETFSNDNYPGTKKYTTSQEILNDIGKLKNDQKLNDIIANTTAQNYYYLTPEDLEDLNITNTENSYIINYKLGIAINVTKPYTQEGDPVYVYAKDRDD